MSTFKIQLKPFKMLSAGEIVALAVQADANFERASKAIERLRREEESQRSAIASRWRDLRVTPSDRQRLMNEETSAALHAIRANAEAELDGYIRRGVEFMRAAEEQHPLYETPRQVLERMHLGESRRSEYTAQLRDAGPVGLARMGQLAVGTGNTALAAAIITVLDRTPSVKRPFTPQELAKAMGLDEWDKVSQALLVIRNRGQSTINAVRALRNIKGGALGAGLADAIARMEEAEAADE